MVWGSTAETYDFSLFEEKNAGSSAAVQRRAQELEQKEEKRQAKVVELPGTKTQRKTAKKNALLLLKVAGFLVICALVANLIYCRAVLTEVNSDIETAQGVLAEQKSITIQLETRRAEKYTQDYVAEYASSKLGMREATDSQIEYFSVYQDDVGTVVQENEEASFLSKIFSKIIEGIS